MAGLHAVSGPLKVHAQHRKGDGPKLSVFAGQPLCDNPRAVEFTMRPWYDEGRDISCHVCLYHLGLYVPLVKLREHRQWSINWPRA